ncbi:MAG: hypothetical protein IJT30_03280 [Muribaculaceae bacterium]|nr:hypothetical protein [Muribaculaceae bacterium]
MTNEELKAMGDRYNAAYNITREIDEITAIAAAISKRGIIIDIPGFHSDLKRLLGQQMLDDIIETLNAAINDKLQELEKQFEEL